MVRAIQQSKDLSQEASCVVHYPDNRLQQPSKRVEDVPSKRVELIVAKMLEALDSEARAAGLAEGKSMAGLAAPQIGINERIILCSFDRTRQSLKVMINPEYTPNGDKTDVCWEMCLSSPTKAAEVRRHTEVEVTYQDIKGTLHKEKLEGFAARVFQHEVDHLNGTLCWQKGEQLKEFANSQEAKTFLMQVRAQHGH